MARALRGLVIAVVLFAAVGPAHGWGRRAQTTAAYYYPPSLVCLPVYPTAGVVAPLPYAPMPPAGAAPVYATPTPAPPEGSTPAAPGPMPPAGGTPGTPGVRESTSYYDAYAATAGPSAQPLSRDRKGGLPDRSSVGFWNSTPRDMFLRVDGIAYRLAANKGLTLDL